MRKIGHFAVIAALLAPTMSAANEIYARNPGSIVAALQDLGYRASLDTDSEGDPMIRSAVEGVDYVIFFYGCTDNLNCEYIQFSAGFNVPDVLTAVQMNDWNRRKLVGEATVDEEGDPWLSFFITTDGGLTRDNFADAVDWWELSVRDFKEFIDW